MLIDLSPTSIAYTDTCFVDGIHLSEQLKPVET